MRLSPSLCFAVLLTASPALGADCTPPPSPNDSCIAGAWIGSSTLPDALKRVLKSMPKTISARFSAMGRPVAMIVYSDGFYETFPMGGQGHADQKFDDGSTGQIDVSVHTTSAMGYLSAAHGQLKFCNLPGTGQMMGEMSHSTSQGMAFVPLSAPPPGSGPAFTPVISYTCAGQRLTYKVELPHPVGEITYKLNRVPMSRFSEAFRARLNADHSARGSE